MEAKGINRRIPNKMNLKRAGCGYRLKVSGAMYVLVASLCEVGNRYSGAIKTGNFFARWLLKKSVPLWSIQFSH